MMRRRDKALRSMHRAADQAAAAWVVRMHSDQRTQNDDLAFQTWLEERPEHAETYASFLRLWDGIAELDSGPLANQVLHRNLPTACAGIAKWTALRDRGVMYGAVAAAACMLLALAMVLIPRDKVYATGLGELRTFLLDDGSNVTLNADTRLEVNIDNAERRLVLDQGQAFFQVAKDAARPFRVFVGEAEVRAVGTEFEVRKFGTEAKVILQQGVVAIYQGQNRLSLQSAPAASWMALHPVALLKPGQEARIVGMRPVAVNNVDVGRAEAWREKPVSFENTSLSEAIAKINRYGSPQIVLSDPSLGELRLSGVFHVDRSESFIEAVTRALPLRVVVRRAGEVVLGRQDAGSSK